MLIRYFLLLPLAVLLAGCAHTNESSAKANKDQIRDRLASQLHFKTLDLAEDGKGHYTGTGQDDSGVFTITVTRVGGNLFFDGAYLPPARGTFSGSAFWDKHSNSYYGVRKEQNAVKTSVGTP